MGMLDAEYELPFTAVHPTLGVTVRRISERTASFNQSPSYPQYTLPAYTTLDLRAGLEIGALSTQFYVRNLLDEEGELSIIFPQFGGRVAILQPRTFGVSVATSF
jgi:hypothetical protein